MKKRRLSEVEARAILAEYPDADLRAFDVSVDVEATAIEEAGATIGKLRRKAKTKAA